MYTAVCMNRFACSQCKHDNSPCQGPVAETLASETPEEHEAAREFNLGWQLRGPQGKPGDVWRKQPWREGSQRFGGRGGKHPDRYTMFEKYGKHTFFHPKHSGGLYILHSRARAFSF